MALRIGGVLLRPPPPLVGVSSARYSLLFFNTESYLAAWRRPASSKAALTPES